MANDKRPVVSFELPQNLLELLQESSAATGMKSHHLHARDLVVDALTSKDTTELQRQMSELEQRLIHLTTLVQRATYSVIVHAAKRSSEEANKWIRENLPSEPEV